MLLDTLLVEKVIGSGLKSYCCFKNVVLADRNTNKQNKKTDERKEAAVLVLSLSASAKLLDQKKSPLILRPMPCLSYRTLNLLMNWFILLQVLVMVPK